MKVFYKWFVCFALVFTCMNVMQGFEENSYTDQKIELVTSDQGVFLLIDGQSSGIEGVYASAEGIFVFGNGEWIPLNEAVRCGLWWYCRHCGYGNPQNVSICLNCKRSRFK